MTIETSNSCRRWNREEVEILQELYPNSPTSEVMIALPSRTKVAIQSKAFDLNIKATKQKISESNQRPCSEEKKRKISKAHKRPDVRKRNLKNNPMHFLKAREKSSKTHKELYINKENHPRYGLIHSDETKDKISTSRKYFYETPEGQKLREEMSLARQGHHFSPETEIKRGIHLSPETEFKKGHITPKGENNPNWKNGKSFEPYSLEFNDKLKEQIRERDDHICQICDMTREESVGKYRRVLSVHHIDGDKKNSDKKNLVTLCNSCNARLESWGVRPQFGVQI